MVPKANLIVEKNANNVFHLNLFDANNQIINITNYSAYSHIRKSDTSSKYFTFGVNILPANGIVTLSLSSAQTAIIPSGRYFYDCILINSSNVHSKIVEGTVTVRQGATKI